MINTPESSSQRIDIWYHMRTTLPTLRSHNNTAIIKEIEKKNKPTNTNEFLDTWTTFIGSKIKYDAMNYALMKEFPLDSKQWGWIDNINLTVLSMSYEQRLLTMKTLQRYQQKLSKEEAEYTDINLLLLSLKNGNFIEFVKLVISMPSLQRVLLSDDIFAIEWMRLYEKRNVSELLQMGIWNCKTLAIMTQKILETGNIRWNLWIKKIDIIEWNDQHVTMNIHTKDTIITYDPTAILYRK